MTSVFGYEYMPAAHLLVTDEDAADFLQSQFSNELRPFETGGAIYGLWLDVKGKVIGDSLVCCEGEEQFRVFSEQTASSTIADKLEQHIIADDVEIEALPAGVAVALIGEGVSAQLEALHLPVPDAGQFVNAAELTIWRGRRSSGLSVELWSASATVITDLKARLAALGVEFVDACAVERVRVEAGIARVPEEVGPADLPGEAGLVGDAVSLTKGCYLGQEVVARMHNLGRPQRGLFRVRGLGEAPVCPIALYNSESKKIGELRTVFPVDEGWQGVALLKTRYAVVGERLKCGADEVEIEALFAAKEMETK